MTSARLSQHRGAVAPSVERSGQPARCTGGTCGHVTKPSSGVVFASVLQLFSDPSPPVELDRQALPMVTGGGGPVPDDDDAVASMEGGGTSAPPAERTGQAEGTGESGESEESEESEEDTAAVQPYAPAAAPGPAGRTRPPDLASSLGAGRPIEPAVRGRMEAFYGHDFGQVRVHTDARATGLARSLNAHAFTTGSQIAFGAGHYRPEAPAGARLLAHELAHVVQQSRGLDAAVLRAGIGEPGDRYEQEAELHAERFANLTGPATPVRPVASTGPARHSSGAVQLYTGSAAATYAKKWALSTNPSFPRYPNDCTNFVSQAVRAGGWTMLGGSCDDRKADSAWWYGSSKCWYPGVRSSYTWAGAHNFSKFVPASGRGSAAAKVSDLDVGDVLQMSFSGSHINHTMMLTEKKDGDSLFSYHTSDHLDEPFWAPGGIFERYPSASYFAWKM